MRAEINVFSINAASRKSSNSYWDIFALPAADKFAKVY